jgi:hypothetical protein
MNKIVRTHYPVEKLPDDLRVGLPASGTVTVTVLGDDASVDTQERSILIEAMKSARYQPTSVEDNPVKRIRELRDEWDE